jgi:hypothetical protein
MPERAGIEAATLADAIFDELSSPGALIGGFDKATLRRAVAAALDRVRDARGGDESVPACVREYHAMLAGDVDFLRAQRAKARADIESARSAQGEDHEGR